MQEFAQGASRTPERDRRVPFLARRLELADHRRQDVSVRDVVVVARPVEVGRHQRMVEKPAVAPQELAELESRDLRNRIPFVRLLELARQQRAFRNRLRRKARINAGRAEEQKAADARFRRRPDRVERNHLVLVEEERVRRAVRADPADARRRDDRDVRILGLVERTDGLGVEQVELRVGSDDKIAASGLLKRPHARRPYHPPMARDIDFGVFIHDSTRTSQPHRRSGLGHRLFLAGLLKVRVDHHLHQLVEPDGRLPAELALRLRGVAEKLIDFGRTQIARVAFDVLLPVEIHAGKGLLEKLLHRVHFAGRENELVGLVVLQDLPPSLDIVAGIAPVAQGIDVAHVELVLKAHLDAPDGARDLARHKGLAAARRLVVEKNAVRGEHSVRLAVVADSPVAVELRDGVGAARIERRRLLLRNLLDESVELRGRRLIELRRLVPSRQVNRLEKAHRPERVDIAGKLRGVEGDADVALRGEVVDFVRLDLVDELDQVRAVPKVSVVEEQLHPVDVRILIQVVDSLGIERGRAADDAVDFITFRKKQFREVASVLSSDARNQRFFHVDSFSLLIFTLRGRLYHFSRAKIMAPIKAVNSATRTSPKLPTSVCTSSALTSVELRKSSGCVPCAAKTMRSVRYPPEYASRSGVVIVATTLLPM